MKTLLSLLIAGLAVTAPAQQTIDQRLEQLEQEIRELKRQRALEQEAAQTKTAPPKPVTVAKAGADGFSVQSADGNFVLKVKGYLQTDARFYLDDTAHNGTDSFLVRRARPIIEGTVFKDFDYRLMLDAGSGQALLQDAYVEWRHWPEVKVRIGKFKPPVGLEQLQNDAWLFFMERGLPSALLPVRDVGAQISGDLLGGAVTYAGGIFNGTVDGASGDLDNGDSKEGVARLFFQPFKPSGPAALAGFGFGVAGTIGNEQTSATITNIPAYRTTGQTTFFSLSRGTVLDGVETRGTPQAYYYVGPVGLFGEYAVSDNEVRRGTLTDHLRNSAWQIQASVVLTGEKASYTGIHPARPFDLAAGDWGAWELVARYGNLRVDPAAFSTDPTPTGQRFADPTRSAQEARYWGIGLNWYLNKILKLALDYEQTDFDGGAGTADATTFTVRNRQTERALFSRMQMTF